MKIPDANVLLYALDPTARAHEPAREWLERALSGPSTVGFAWVTLLAVVRLSTNPAIYAPPLSVSAAFEVIEGWLAQPPAMPVGPGERHLTLLNELLVQAGTAGNLTTDAHLAALAIEHGATLVSFDADFHRFSGLRFEFLS